MRQDFVKHCNTEIMDKHTNKLSLHYQNQKTNFDLTEYVQYRKKLLQLRGSIIGEVKRVVYVESI